MLDENLQEIVSFMEVRGLFIQEKHLFLHGKSFLTGRAKSSLEGLSFAALQLIIEDQKTQLQIESTFKLFKAEPAAGGVAMVAFGSTSGGASRTLSSSLCLKGSKKDS